MSDIEEHFKFDNIVIRTENKKRKVLKKVIKYFCFLFLILFMNYISFCIGFIYCGNNEDGSLSLM